MSALWIKAVTNAGEDGKDKKIVLDQLISLKRALKTALSKRDWPTVGRIDRLSAQIVNNLGPADREMAKKVVRELLEIRALYHHSIVLIEDELRSV